MPAPTTDDLYLGTGYLEVSDDGGSTWDDLGYATAFSITVNVTVRQVYVPRGGERTLIKEPIDTKEARASITLISFTPSNLARAMGGTVSTNTAGQSTFTGLDNPSKLVQLRFTGDNNEGPVYAFLAERFRLRPSGQAIDMLTSGQEGTLPIEGLCEVDSNGANAFQLTKTN